MQHMILAAVLLGLFHRDHVRRLFDHANLVFFAIRVTADVALRAILVVRMDFAEAETAVAQPHFLAQPADAVGETKDIVPFALQHVKR